MNLVRKLLVILASFAWISSETHAQSIGSSSKDQIRPSIEIDTLDPIVSQKGNFPKKAKDVLEGLQIGGYYRFVTNIRKMKEVYSHLDANKTNIFVGDDSQIPQLMLNINGNVSEKASFGTDLFLWSPMTGLGQTENVKGLNLGVSLFGNFSTDFGNFSVKTGGINWYMLSPFTFQTNRGYNRFSIFERNPWDPNTPQIDSRYSDFYSSGAINQDQRWGNQAFQGLIVEGAQLPNRFSFSAMYGKTQFDGGYAPLPNTSFGGRLKKDYKNNYVAFNTFNNNSQIDSVKEGFAGFNIGTLELLHHFKKVKIYAELGLGRRYTSGQQQPWGEAVSIKLSRDIAKKVPLEVHLYRISPRVLNNNAIFINSSIQQTTQSAAANQPVLIPVSSAVLPIGQLSNNRQGIDLNTQVDFGRFKNSIGYSNSAEIENISRTITYSHVFNNLALSRFWRWDFPSNVGPYQNLNKIYRSVFETLQLTELDSTGLSPLKRKYFNTVELNSKYKSKLLGKDLYVFYLGTFSSVQNELSAMVNFSEKSLLRVYCHQLETYYSISPKVVWNNYISFERVIANYQTSVDVVTRRPKNQTGYSAATGFDIQLSRNVGLYIRQRWMKYKDTSFEKDKYQGWESTIELKAFF